MSHSAKRSLSPTSETAAQPKPKAKARPSNRQRAMSMDSSPLAVPPPERYLASSAQPLPAQPTRPTANHPPLQPFSSVLPPSAPTRSTQATTNPAPWPPSQAHGPRAVPVDVPTTSLTLAHSGTHSPRPETSTTPKPSTASATLKASIPAVELATPQAGTRASHIIRWILPNI
jgi:hypothetical protein